MIPLTPIPVNVSGMNCPICHLFPAMAVGILIGMAIAATVFIGYLIYLDYKYPEENEDASTDP